LLRPVRRLILVRSPVSLPEAQASVQQGGPT
jgi:hypothetical protein